MSVADSHTVVEHLGLRKKVQPQFVPRMITAVLHAGKKARLYIKAYIKLHVSSVLSVARPHYGNEFHRCHPVSVTSEGTDEAPARRPDAESWWFRLVSVPSQIHDRI